MRAKLIANAVPIAELLPKNSDIRVLLEVLPSMGLKVRETDKYLIFHNHSTNGLYYRASGEIKTWGLERVDISELKRAYSKELANHQARHTGGQVAGLGGSDCMFAPAAHTNEIVHAGPAEVVIEQSGPAVERVVVKAKSRSPRRKRAA